jgi:hypothetical protein
MDLISTTLTSGFHGDPNWEWVVKKDIELQSGSPLRLVVQAALVHYGLWGLPYKTKKLEDGTINVSFDLTQQIVLINVT